MKMGSTGVGVNGLYGAQLLVQGIMWGGAFIREGSLIFTFSMKSLGLT